MMTGSSALFAGILLISVFVSSISQVMLKKAAMRSYDSHLKEYANPLVIFAYTLFVGCTLLTVLAYQGIPLSWGPVLEATSYVYITIFGVWFFKEHVSRTKIIALGLILTGIAVYAFLG